MNASLPSAGVFPALWTPIDSSGRLLDATVKRHAAFLHRSGVQGLMVLGSTGEFPFFTPDERADLLRQITPLVAPLPVLANISDVNPRAVAMLARAAKDAGCAAVAVLPPWYYPTTQPDLLEFFLRAAEAAAPLPVFLYNFPERVGLPITLDTIAAFADRAPLAGIKLSGGNWEFHHEVVALARAKRFEVWTGWDTRLADAMALGCTGCITGLGNFAAEWIAGTFRAVHAGNTAEAQHLTQKLRAMAAELSPLPFPHDVAAGLLARGLDVGETKQVLSPQTQQVRAKVTAALKSHLQELGPI